MDNLDLLLVLGGAHHQAADSPETIDTDFDGRPAFDFSCNCLKRDETQAYACRSGDRR